MALSVATAGVISATTTGENIIATITSANVYDLNVDVNSMVGGTTPTIIIIREYGKPRATGTERMIKAYTLVGAQTEKHFKTIARVSPHHIKYSLTRVQGTGNSYPVAVYQVQ